MISFENDYSEGCHPRILDAFVKTNDSSQSGYGFDDYTMQAKEKIKEALNNQNVEITFMVGGTQTNEIVISALLKPYQGVISASSGHISVHEAGAIEAHGHKVLTLPSNQGKINVTDLQNYLDIYFKDESFEHMVCPGMVYISQPTEYGTLYSKKELEDIYTICQKYKMPFYIDGARLGYALASKDNDVSLHDLSLLCDVFYIGGTKVGALCGEAVVFKKEMMPPHFFSIMKQQGAIVAKGRLLGLQFLTLFEDCLYEKIASNAIEHIETIKKTLDECGYSYYLKSPTNQQFLIVENKKFEKIRRFVKLSAFEAYDKNHTVVRICTSWHTTKEDTDKLCQILRENV